MFTHSIIQNAVEIAATFASTQAVMVTPFLVPQQGGFVFSTGVSEEANILWASTYADDNILLTQAHQKGLLQNGSTFIDTEVIPQQELLKSRFYREFLSTLNIGRALVSVVFGGAPDFPTTIISIFRNFREPAFNEQDKAWIKLLVAHVSQAMALTFRLETRRV